MANDTTVLQAQELVSTIHDYFVNNNKFLEQLSKAVNENGLDKISKKDMFQIILDISKVSHLTMAKIEPDLVKVVDFYTKFKPVVRA